jgi:hypothetical protein
MPATFSSDTLAIDSIIGGRVPSAARKVTLLSGEANRVRGSVLGRKATAGTIAGAAQAGNTGTGAISALTVGAAARIGRYRVVFIEPGTNAGTFAVFGPDGREVGNGTVPTAFAGEINFTIADSVDFVSGDTFNVDVTALTYKYLLSAIAAVDGSQYPEAILAEDADATAGDVEALVYENGEYNVTQLTFGTGHTAATTRDVLRQKGIVLIDAQTIVNP